MPPILLQLILDDAPGSPWAPLSTTSQGATCQPRLLDACSWKIDRSWLDLINAQGRKGLYCLVADVWPWRNTIRNHQTGCQ